MEGIALAWLWSMLYVNGHITPVAGFILVLIVLGAITKYILLPVKRVVNDINVNILPDISDVVDDMQEETSALTIAHTDIINEQIAQAKTLEATKKDIEDAKSTLNKIDGMLSIAAFSTSRGIK